MADKKDLDLVGKLDEERKRILSFRLRSISPDDGKYGEKVDSLRDYISAEAEWITCAQIQNVLLETRAGVYGQATRKQVDEVEAAITKVSWLNMSLLEEKVTTHDQLAILEEIGRFVPEQTKALLHPGTTSYDILDTARSYLFKGAWKNVMRPEISRAIVQLSDIGGRSLNILQVGRTHLQDTSPVSFGGTLIGYAARLAERTKRLDESFDRLKGKISGIVGTGASIDAVIGEGFSRAFEFDVLNKLGLQADYTATQIVQKEALADVGHGLTTLMRVLGDFANDIRMMYSSAINEVTSRDNAQRLGGSSADATKNNPVDWENIAGKAVVVESGMRILYEMIASDFQRDLRGSVQGRYQPQAMMAQTYESFKRLNKALPQLSVNEDRMMKNLQPVRYNPSEAMVAILRGEQWVHSEYGVGHDFVKEIGKIAKKSGRKLLEVAREDKEFNLLYERLSQRDDGKDKIRILNGEMELYLGSAVDRAMHNLDYIMEVTGVKIDKYKYIRGQK